MNAIHAGITKGVSELLESPTHILKRAEAANKPGAILNHNKPVGYIVSRSMIMDSGLGKNKGTVRYAHNMAGRPCAAHVHKGGV